MIRRHVLAALAAGVAAGDEDAARAAVGRADWILRGAARRRLEGALIDASLASGVLDASTPDAARHRLRAAALLVGVAGAAGPPEPAALRDAGAVARAYRELRAAAPPRAPLATIAALAAALLALGGAVTAVGRSMAAADASAHAFARPAPPAPVGAYRDGGAPRRDEAIEAVLARELPRLLAGAPGAAAALADHPAFARHGAALRDAWRGLVDCAARLAALAGDDTRPSYRRAAAELRERARAVSDQLAAAGLGYLVDAGTGLRAGAGAGRTPASLAGYRVDEVTFVRADTRRIRVLGLRRLDAPAAGPAPHGDVRLPDVAALGVTRAELADPVVLLAQVDAKVEAQLLPVLAGAPFPIGADTWLAARAGRQLAHVAGAAIRRELIAALGADAAVPEAAAARCRKLVAASVGRHEAQHGLDHAAGEPRHPQALVAALGRTSAEFALRARLELSAYLSQLASDTWLPQLVLWSLARHAFRDATAGIEEAYVAVVVIEGLARRYGLTARGPIVREDGRVDRERLAALAAPLAELGTMELRSAAAALWQELFGAPLVRIYDDL